MKIYSWNVNGVRAVIRKKALQSFLKEHQPDILCLQETKANKEQVEIDLPEYIEYWHSADRKGYAGTAIFTKTEAKTVINGLPDDIVAKYALEDEFGDTAREGRVLTLEFDDFFLSTVYTPNAKDNLKRLKMRTQWDPAYLEFVRDLEKTKPVIFCGDLNVAHTEDDLARPKENVGKKGFTKEEIAGLQAFIDAGFTDTFRMFHQGNGHYTWWTAWGGARERNVGWRIDYFMTSKEITNRVTNANIHADVMGSDHCPVSIDLRI
ncbi:MAG: exodeoxyribonuclease III [Candidatus Saccharimonadales bacterium]|nr:exodeoxyribonuclease III [Candidatus Saccharimonadales bacterium]